MHQYGAELVELQSLDDPGQQDYRIQASIESSNPQEDTQKNDSPPLKAIAIDTVETVPLISYDEGDLPRYANRGFLSRYFPETDPESKGARTYRVRMSRRSVFLKIQLLLSILVIAANVCVTVWALVTASPVNGIGTLLTGKCTVVSQLDSGVHAVINVLSSALLGAGSYCMQILVAPSPAEVKAAHAKGRYLEFGCHSTRNFRHISRKRIILWVGLGVTSTLLHLLWNSVIFSSLPLTLIPVAFVTNDFLFVGDNWLQSNPSIANVSIDNTNVSINTLHEAATNFTRLNSSECIQRYINPLAAAGELVVVVNETASQNNDSSLIFGFISGIRSSEWDNSGMWICASYQGDEWTRTCTLDWAKEFQDDWKVTNNAYDSWHYNRILIINVTVDFCLAGPSGDQDSKCGLHYSSLLLIFVCISSAIQAGLIAWVALRCREQTHIVIGDAISDGLKNKQDSEANSVGNELVKLGCGLWTVEKRQRWFAALSKRVWITSAVVCFAFLVVVVVLFSMGISKLKGNGLSTTLAALWKQGLGRTNSYSMMGGTIGSGDQTTSSLLGHVLFANCWQLLMSFLYLFYNNILTRQLVANEVIGYLREKKSLRVSTPENTTQRSTYFLSLPFRYSGPLMAAFILLHWLVNQSIFVVQTTAWGPGVDSQRLTDHDASRLGYSVISELCSLVLGILIVLALVINSFRLYPPAPRGWPQLATNSSAIAALCHRPAEDSDAYLYPVQLGVVDEGVSIAVSECKGRITFTSDWKVTQPQENEWYELPRIPVERTSKGPRHRTFLSRRQAFL